MDSLASIAMCIGEVINFISSVAPESPPSPDEGSLSSLFPPPSADREATDKRIIDVEKYFFTLVEESVKSLEIRKQEIESQQLKIVDVHSILIRRPESWNSVVARLVQIKSENQEDLNVAEWINFWMEMISNLQETNLSRVVSLRKLKTAQSFLDGIPGVKSDKEKAEKFYIEHNEKYNKDLTYLKIKLNSCRAKITEQLGNPKYQNEPYKSMLEYLDYHWAALTVFFDSPEISMIDGGGFVFQNATPKSGIDSYLPYLNHGTPGVILVSSSEKSWVVKVVLTDKQIPESERSPLEEQSQKIKDLLEKQLSSGVLSPIRTFND